MHVTSRRLMSTGNTDLIIEMQFSCKTRLQGRSDVREPVSGCLSMRSNAVSAQSTQTTISRRRDASAWHDDCCCESQDAPCRTLPLADLPEIPNSVTA